MIRRAGSLTTVIGLLSTLAGFGGASAAPRAGMDGPNRPPRPIVRSDIDRVHAARGSYCWFTGNRGICVDTIDPIEFAPRLLTDADQLVVRMRLPVKNLKANVNRQERVPVSDVGTTGKVYRLDLSGQPQRKIDLELFARYTKDRGDGAFAVRVRRAGEPG